MATSFKIIYTSAFLLAVVVFSNEIISMEGRQLKTQINKQYSCENHAISICDYNSGNNHEYYFMRRDVLEHEADSEPAAGTADEGRSGTVDNVEAGDADDFRPTDPGHSPGAGHSKGPRSADIPNL
ncbi:hypothetical protein I3842_15G061100 [Carya illinoinensis]|uniref:Uncharacterized protein n=1 Tax=Carya illinoinensis TaxID=32201 RepID=A0A922D688_CARIL|nr:hypothetical protein I3842_15G061100 [Carya illinoinensis]